MCIAAQHSLKTNWYELVLHSPSQTSLGLWLDSKILTWKSSSNLILASKLTCRNLRKLEETCKGHQLFLRFLNLHLSWNPSSVLLNFVPQVLYLFIYHWGEAEFSIVVQQNFFNLEHGYINSYRITAWFRH